MPRKFAPLTGQGLIEYTLIVAILALLSIPAFSFLSTTSGTVLSAHHDSVNTPINATTRFGTCVEICG